MHSAVLVYAIPYGGPASLVWGWAVCSVFLMAIALSLAELASAAPVAGGKYASMHSSRALHSLIDQGLYYWTFNYSSLKYRKVLAWLVGCIALSCLQAVLIVCSPSDAGRHQHHWLHFRRCGRRLCGGSSNPFRRHHWIKLYVCADHGPTLVATILFIVSWANSCWPAASSVHCSSLTLSYRVWQRK